MLRFTRVALLLVGLVALAPVIAHAQASIAGVVRDASGAVLPGVTVEATSPVLIEKVRTAVTDGNGQYRLIDLRPGTYAVTFTLSGFSPVRREAIMGAQPGRSALAPCSGGQSSTCSRSSPRICSIT